MAGREAARKLLQLRQDSLSVADNAVDFRTLAAEGAWNPEALFGTFLYGLSEEGRACSPGTTNGTRLTHHFNHPDRWSATGTLEGEEV